MIYCIMTDILYIIYNAVLLYFGDINTIWYPHMPETVIDKKKQLDKIFTV